ncbi:MAG: DUF1826 domain-containing protein [Terricaulis sp.]
MQAYQQLSEPSARLSGEWWRVSDDIAVLNAICEPHVGIALWRRSLTPSLRKWLRRLARSGFEDIRFVCEAEKTRHLLDGYCAGNGAHNGAACNEFLSDIARTAVRFAHLAGCSHVECRIESIQDDACRKFHRDNVSLRLLSTYVGPGTEFVSVHDADRALDMQGLFSGKIMRAPTESVAIMRGGKEAGVVHRSPPIEDTELNRILFCLDPAPPS